VIKIKRPRQHYAKNEEDYLDKLIQYGLFRYDLSYLMKGSVYTQGWPGPVYRRYV